MVGANRDGADGSGLGSRKGKLDLEEGHGWALFRWNFVPYRLITVGS